VKISRGLETEIPTTIEPIRKDGIDAGPLRLNRITWHQHYREALHEHVDSRIVVLVAGDFYERFGARSRECGPGTAIYRTPCEPHLGNYSRDGGLYVSVAIPTEAYAEPGFYGVPHDTALTCETRRSSFLELALQPKSCVAINGRRSLCTGSFLKSWSRWDAVTKQGRYQSHLGSTASAHCYVRTGDRRGH